MGSSDLIKLNVYFSVGDTEYKVGELADSQGQVYFEYDAAFIEQGIELSPFKLPLEKKFFKNISRPELFGLPGVFFDSLPDGWGLLVMDRVFRSKGINPDGLSALSRLAYLGDRAMGALRYAPESDLLESNQLLPLDIAELARESELILEGATQLVIKEVVIAGGSPGGARPKALIGLNTDTNEAVYGVYDVPEGYQHYVVKFRGFKDPHTMGIVEYVYSLMARQAGIVMPDTRLIHSGKDDFFAIRRFDREGNHKHHTHTLAGLLHSDFRKPETTYDHLFKVTRHLTNNQQDVIEAFRRMVFNVLAYNRDDHSKNFSFLMDDSGQWSLSPAYDVVYSAAAAGWHTMDISGKKYPSIADMLKLATDNGIKKTKANEIVSQVQEAISQWRSLADEYGVESHVIDDISEAMSTVSKAS